MQETGEWITLNGSDPENAFIRDLYNDSLPDINWVHYQSVRPVWNHK